MKPSLRPRLLRIALVLLLLVVCLQDWPAARAWQAFDALPDMDFAAQTEQLRAEGRHDEALLVVAAGMEALPPDRAEALHWQGMAIQSERSLWSYRAAEAGRGAWYGTGHSSEALAGAVVSDLLVFGDVRDLVIQSSRGARGEPVDPVIVALSGVGIALTAAPMANTGASLLKLARKSGALSSRFGQQLLRMSRRALQRRDAGRLKAVASDAATLQRSAGPAVSLRILRHVDHADDLARAARVSAMPGGAFALWAGGRPGLRWLRNGQPGSEALLLRAARKGPEGAALLMRSGKLMLRPHPLTGLVKSFYKGNIPQLFERALRRYATPVLGVLSAWLLMELLLLRARLRRRRQQPVQAFGGLRAAPAMVLVGSLLLAGTTVVHAAVERAPTWSLKTPDGDVVRFPDDMQGQPTLLFFWPSWCPFSRAMQPYVQDIWEDYREAGAQVWTINIRENADPLAVMRERGLSFPVLLDGDALIATYGISRTPWLVVVDAERRIVYKRPADPPSPIDVAKNARKALNTLLGDAAVPLPDSYPPPYDLHLRSRREAATPAQFGEDIWQAWVRETIAGTTSEAKVSDVAELGAVSDGRTAITHARALWAQRWGEDAVRARAPFRAFRHGNHWVAVTTGDASHPGDGFVAVLTQDAGRVLHIEATHLAPQD